MQKSRARTRSSTFINSLSAIWDLEVHFTDFCVLGLYKDLKRCEKVVFLTLEKIHTHSKRVFDSCLLIFFFFIYTTLK